MQTIFIRLDANKTVGLGHLYRSLAIAKEISKVNNNVFFLISNDIIAKKEIEKANFCYILKQENQTEEDFLLNIVENNEPNLIFIDKLFPYTKEFILKLKKYTKVALFHNICEGAFFSDIFILPSAHTDKEIIFSKKWKTNPVNFYYGSKYIVLNENVIKLKKKREKAKIKNDKIVIVTGGSDPGKVLNKILLWVNDIKFENFNIFALIGIANSNKKELKKINNTLKYPVILKDYNINDISDTKLVITTFGVSVYEFFYAGIPVISIGHATANAKGSKNIALWYNSLIDLGFIKDLNKTKFTKEVLNTINSSKLTTLTKNAKKIIDDKGAKRVAKILLSYE